MFCNIADYVILPPEPEFVNLSDFIFIFSSLLNYVTLRNTQPYYLFFQGIYIVKDFFVLYSTPFHLPPLRFHCVGGCWDLTQDSSPSKQCSGSGSTCFWVSCIRTHQLEVWILILRSSSSKKNLDSFCFVTYFGLFIFEK